MSTYDRQRRNRMTARHNATLIALGALPSQLGPIKDAIDAIEDRHHRWAMTYFNDEQADHWHEHWELMQRLDRASLCAALPKLPPEVVMFNQDARGYCLKINNDVDAGLAIIAATGCVKDWGGYGLLCSAAYT